MWKWLRSPMDLPDQEGIEHNAGRNAHRMFNDKTKGVEAKYYNAPISNRKGWEDAIAKSEQFMKTMMDRCSANMFNRCIHQVRAGLFRLG
jgi:hypothetical protein